MAAGQSPLGTPKSPGKKALATEKVCCISRQINLNTKSINILGKAFDILIPAC